MAAPNKNTSVTDESGTPAEETVVNRNREEDPDIENRGRQNNDVAGPKSFLKDLHLMIRL